MGESTPKICESCKERPAANDSGTLLCLECQAEADESFGADPESGRFNRANY